MKALAVFTIVRNEKFFLPLWLQYYRTTGADIYVLDHESNDGSTDGTGFVKINVSRPVTDDCGWLLATVQGMQRDLLRDHERVVFAEADEFLVPDPDRYSDLESFLRVTGGETITAQGWDVCGELLSPDLDPGRPILDQRQWKRNTRYDKTLISSIPLEWEVGFHRAVSLQSQPPHPHLKLIHLHYADLETAWERLVSRMAGREPAPGDWGRQNKIRNRVVFEADFASATCDTQPIPDEYRNLL